MNIPLQAHGDQLALELRVGGSSGHRFLIDTGAGVEAWIDSSLADRLGSLVVGRVRVSDGSAGGLRLRSLVELPELEAMGVRARRVTAVVADLAWLDLPGEPAVHGILGFPLFRELLLTIDYPGMRLELTSGSLSRTGAHLLRYDDSRGVPDVELLVGGRRMQALLDTGARAAVSFPGELAANLRRLAPPVRLGAVRTVNRELETFGAVLESPVQLAGFRLENVGASFTTADHQVVIGAALLRHFALTFDQGNRRARLSQPD